MNRFLFLMIVFLVIVVCIHAVVVVVVCIHILYGLISAEERV